MTDIELYNSFDGIALNEKSIEKIKARLPEFHRATSQIGHSHSQASYTLQTLQEFSSPLQKMKQCVIQINKRYRALEETHFNIEKTRLDMEKIQFSNDRYDRLELKKYEANMVQTKMLMESSLRELGMFQDIYDGIMKANNIPENWSEKDFEDQEISHMIRSAFRIAVQNLTGGNSVNRSALDYFEQLGINPTLAEARARGYIIKSREKVNAGKTVTINDYYDFLDMMAVEFKDSYKLALARIGLTEIGSAEFMSSGISDPTQ
tara:strand:+ start:4115 stop:4903 length:789 start_codon:yes stop_codon:yes gene_type:complete